MSYGQKHCNIIGCEQPHCARGFCQSHWKKWKRWGDPLTPDMRGWNKLPNSRDDIKSRFMEYVAINGACWDWTGAPEKSWGYGRIKINGKSIRAHRLSYEFHVGPIPTGLLVCHTCDRPICVNPEHLFLGTDLDNQRDCISKGRTNYQSGVAHWNARLRPSEVLEIKASNDPPLELARRFSVSTGTIYAIRKGIIWRNVV